MTLHSSGYPGARLLVAALLLASGMTAQAFDMLKPFKGLFSSDEVIVWQGPGQFVKVVEQDRIKKDRRPAKNSHPADLSPGQLATVLASLNLETAGKTVPVFTQSEVTLLAGKLAEAFAKALPTQDIVFAIAGGGDGTAATHTTAGRMFLQGSRLQIIFGDVHGPVDGDASNTSHFAEPHRAGKRKERIDRELVIADGPGISYFTASDRPRMDWVMIDVPAVIAAWHGPLVLPAAAPVPVAAPGVPPAPQAATPAATAPAPAPVAPAAGAAPITAEQQRQLEERRQMAEEMARLRKQVQEQNAAGTSASAPSAAPSPPATTSAATPVNPAKAGKSIEERLSTLQELHAKKLITDEEYAAKRKALLEEL